MDASADSRKVMMTEEAVSDKRRYYRNDSLKELSVVWHHGGQRFISPVHNLSLGGAFIQSAEPPPFGTILKLLFRVSGKVARARAVVRRSVPNEGMGIEFVAMEHEDRACLAVAAESARELIPVTDKQRRQSAFSDEMNPTLPHETVCRQKDRALSVVERRAHPRPKVTAQVQVVQVDSGKRVSARLGNLSAGGCFLELETDSSFPLGTTVAVAITRGSQSFQSEAKVVYVLPPKGMGVTFAETELQQLRILAAWIVESLWLSADRRQSQRIFLDVPVQVMGHDTLGIAFSEDTRTLKVSADGCSLPLSAPVNKGQHVTLVNIRTRAMLDCVVVRIEQSSGARHEIGMAFVLPNRKFWQVSFPPVD